MSVLVFEFLVFTVFTPLLCQRFRILSLPDFIASDTASVAPANSSVCSTAFVIVFNFTLDIIAAVAVTGNYCQVAEVDAFRVCDICL